MSTELSSKCNTAIVLIVNVTQLIKKQIFSSIFTNNAIRQNIAKIDNSSTPEKLRF